MRTTKYEYIELSEVRDKIEKGELAVNDTVFWVGAGIDKLEPTCLPLAQELLETILEKTCGTNGIQLLSSWENIQKTINNNVESENVLSSIPRLESIIERLLLCEAHMQEKKTVLEMICCFKDAPPNKNHYALANALKNGANIVTTNYSFGIQQAYNETSDEDKYLLLDEHICGSSTYVYKSKYPGSGKLYHIHGIATELEQLGASLKIVKNEFPEIFRKQLEEWIVNKKIFFFCGYSGSDVFDVNRFFLSKQEDSIESSAFFVRHMTNSISPSFYITEKEHILLRSFRDKYVLNADTANFFQLFNEKQMSEATEEKACFNWKEKFKFSGYKEEEQKLLLVDLCHFMGMNISLIYPKDWEAEKKEEECYSLWYRTYPCFAMARLQADNKLIKKYGERLKEEELGENPTYVTSIINNSLMTYMGYSDMSSRIFENTYEIIKNKDKISWNISTDVHQYINYLVHCLKQYTTKNEVQLAREKFSPTVKEIMKICNYIIDGGYNYVEEINQLHLALRDKALLKQMFENKHEEALMLIKESTYYYIEESSIDGILGNLNTEQMILIFEYIETESSEILEKIRKKEVEIITICEATNFVRHQKILKDNISFLLKFSSL